jgi:ABC-2 type transport system ATP-binding protein
LSAPAIALYEASKRFGRVLALDRICFTIAPGEVIGFVGPNGSGKTTTLRMISGFLDPDAGRVEVAGHDVTRERTRVRAGIGYMPESVPLYSDMRVAEFLRFRGRLKRLGRDRTRERVAQVAGLCGLGEHQQRIIGQLSKGFRQRVGLADALLGEPPILLLDEPTSGLDPVQVREFRKLIAGLAERHTIVISSHILSEIEVMASRIIMLARGRVVGDGTLAELRTACGLDDTGSLEDVFVALAGNQARQGQDAGQAGQQGEKGEGGEGGEGGEEDAP